MSGGIRATVEFRDPGECPIAAATAGSEVVLNRVSTTVSPADEPGAVSELVLAGTPDADVDLTEVFEYGGATVYRTPHGEADCPCTTLARHGCPVHRYVARDGRLRIVFHVPEFETLQTVMGIFRERYPPVDVQRLLQPPVDASADDQVLVNRGKLTDRQFEVLQTAHGMGYFDHPRAANATEIAAELDIAQSTFTEHLMAAQRKLLEDIIR